MEGSKQKDTKKISKSSILVTDFIHKYIITLSFLVIIMAFVAGLVSLMQNIYKDNALAVANPTVSITGIVQRGLDYEVSFTGNGFTNGQSNYGTNFFLKDIEQETTINRLFLGDSPYILDQSEIPNGATELCSVVVTSLINVLPSSGNCFAIPVFAEPNVILGSAGEVDQNLNVDFTISNFTNSRSGIYTNFYFDTEGKNTTSHIYTGQSPFVIAINDIPDGATKICVVLVNIDTVINQVEKCQDLNPTPVCTQPSADRPECPLPIEKSATISNITTDNDTIYVTFSVDGFTNTLNGDHTRFYFNTGSSSDTSFETYSSPYSIPISQKPSTATQLCVIVVEVSTVIPNSGNCFNLPTQEVSINPVAQITGITVAGDNINVAFTTVEFNNPSTAYKTRFYYNTETSSTSNKEFTQASPFTILKSSVPTTATQLCVIVVNSQTSAVISNSGNCFAIPTLTTNTTTNNNTNTTATTSAPFQLNSTTLRLTSELAPTKTSYDVGEAMRFDVRNIKKGDGTAASNASCVFKFTFTPASTNVAQVVNITKLTDSTGSCFVSIDGTGKISQLPFAFDISAQAQTAAVGSTTALFNQNGTGTVQVSVVGSDNKTYFTNASNFTVGTVSTGALARTGGLSLAIIVLIAVSMIISLIAASASKKVNKKKTLLK